MRTNTGFCFPSWANHWSMCSGFLVSSGEPGKLIYGQCDQKRGESCPKLVLKSTCSFPLMVEGKKESSEDVEGDRATGWTEFGSLNDFTELNLSATPRACLLTQLCFRLLTSHYFLLQLQSNRPWTCLGTASFSSCSKMTGRWL